MSIHRMRYLVVLGIVLLVAVVLAVSITLADSITEYELIDNVSGESWNGANGSQANTVVQPSIAVNPGNRNDLVATYQESRFELAGGSAAIGVITSTNGASSWAGEHELDLTLAVTSTAPYTRGTYANAAWLDTTDTYNTALILVTGLELRPGSNNTWGRELFAYRSTTKGQIWTRARVWYCESTQQNPCKAIERPRLGVDNDPNSTLSWASLCRLDHARFWRTDQV